MPSPWWNPSLLPLGSTDFLQNSSTTFYNSQCTPSSSYFVFILYILCVYLDVYMLSPPLEFEIHEGRDMYQNMESSTFCGSKELLTRQVFINWGMTGGNGGLWKEYSYTARIDAFEKFSDAWEALCAEWYKQNWGNNVTGDLSGVKENTMINVSIYFAPVCFFVTRKSFDGEVDFNVKKKRSTKKTFFFK